MHASPRQKKVGIEVEDPNFEWVLPRNGSPASVKHSSTGNTIIDYQLSIKAISYRRNYVNWAKLSPSDQLLETSYKKLNSPQRNIYFALVRLLRKHVTRNIGVPNFDQTWHRLGNHQDCTKFFIP